MNKLSETAHETTISVSKPDLTNAEVEAVAEVVRSGWITQGPKVQEFETKLTAFTQSKHAFCVTSCTTGLFLAFKSLGIGPGDEVIVPSYSFIATANSVAHTGATPVFADIDLETFNMTVESARAAITSKTKAILVVHQGGTPADIEAFQTLAREKGLFLLEDAACAIGSTYKGKPIGAHSDLVILSFHPRKLVSTGEGGAILYNGNDPAIVNFLDISRRHGMSLSDLDRHKSDKVLIETYPIIGYNFRMTDMQAAMGIVQLERLPEMLKKRRAIALRYQEALGGIQELGVPHDPKYGMMNFQTFLLTVKKEAKFTARELMDFLSEKKIITRRGIMSAHEEACYDSFTESKKVSLANTERAVRENIVLPLYSQMTEADTTRVINGVLECVQKYR